jgi:hypothetical protein
MFSMNDGHVEHCVSLPSYQRQRNVLKLSQSRISRASAEIWKLHNLKWESSLSCTHVYILQNCCRNKSCVFSQYLLPGVISDPDCHCCYCRSRLTISPCPPSCCCFCRKLNGDGLPSFRHGRNFHSEFRENRTAVLKFTLATHARAYEHTVTLCSITPTVLVARWAALCV